MKVLVTGADGFVGSWLVPRLLEGGHAVTASVLSADTAAGAAAQGTLNGAIDVVALDVRNAESVRRVCERDLDAILHLAAVSSGGDAQRDPGAAWEVNAAGTARLADYFASAADEPVTRTFLVVSSLEVYGAGMARRWAEEDRPRPISPYAASKLGAELAALEVHRRTGLRTVVARAGAHTGRGQDTRFVVPAFARRLLEARSRGERQVRVGNLDPVRDLLHVSDVVEAYVDILERGEPGEIYNVASGHGVSLRDVFERLRTIVGVEAEPIPASELVRPVDIPHLVGDSAKLRRLTGWTPRTELAEALREVVDAQAK